MSILILVLVKSALCLGRRQSSTEPGGGELGTFHLQLCPQTLELFPQLSMLNNWDKWEGVKLFSMTLLVLTMNL